MKKILTTLFYPTVLVLMLFIASSCSTPGWYLSKYNLKLDSVEIDQGVKIGITDSNIFSSDDVDIKIDILERRFILVNVNNKGNLPITIDWYKFSFIDSENQSLALKFKRDIPITMIPPKSHISMSDFVYFHRKYNYNFNVLYPKFSSSDILPFVFTESVEQRDILVEYYVGKSVSFYLPLKFGDGKTVNYRLNLSIESIDIRQNNPDTHYTVSKPADFPIINKR